MVQYTDWILLLYMHYICCHTTVVAAVVFLSSAWHKVYLLRSNVQARVGVAMTHGFKLFLLLVSKCTCAWLLSLPMEVVCIATVAQLCMLRTLHSAHCSAAFA
jgi:hypothetical protein